MKRSLILAGVVLIAAAWAQADPDGGREVPRPELPIEFLDLPLSGGPITPDSEGDQVRLSRLLPFHIVNGDFSILGGDGHPVGWSRFGNVLTLNDAGDNYALTNLFSQYRQSFPLPAPWQHVGLTMRGRGELGAEAAVFSTWQSGGVGIPDLFYNVFRFLPGPGWSTLYATIPIVDGRTGFNFAARTILDRHWADLDDIAVFDSGLRDGGFESDTSVGSEPWWAFEGGAAVSADSAVEGASALVLPPGAVASQVAAAIQDGQEYFVTGTSWAPGGGGELTAREQWLSGTAEELPPSGGAISVEATPTRWLSRATSDDSGAASRVELFNSSASEVRVDDVSRGFTMVYPRAYYPGGRGVPDRVRFYACWPEKLLTGTVAIIPDGGAPAVATLTLSVDDGASLAEWDGDGAQAGDYTARFTLTSATGPALVIDRPFTVHSETVVGEPAPYNHPEFASVAWMWLYTYGDTPEDLRPILQAAMADGFNMALLFGRPEQLPVAAQVCEELELPFIYADDRIGRFIKLRSRLNELSEESFTEFLEGVLGEVPNSPYYRGYYLVDEPEVLFDQQNASAAMRLTAARPDWGPAFTTFTPATAASDSVWDAIKPPVHWVDPYPFDVANQDIAAGLAWYADVTEEQVAKARARGRDYWPVICAATYPDLGLRLVAPATTRAMIGTSLAIGARGWAPFSYTPITIIEGIRGVDGEELPEAAVWREENLRVGGASAALMDLHDHARFSPAEGPVLVTTATDSLGSTIVYLVNLECRASATAQLGFTADVALTELTTDETRITKGGAITMMLGPGEWQAWRMTEGSLLSVESASVNDGERLLRPRVILDVVPANTPVRDLAWSPDGERLAVVHSNRVSVISGGAVFASAAIENGYRAAFLEGDRLAVSDRNIGLRVFDIGSSALTPRDGFLRRTGTAWDVLATPNGAWISQDYLGLRLLDIDASGGAAGVELLAPPTGIREIFGPFKDGAIIAADENLGLYRIAPPDYEAEELWHGPRVWRGDLSPGRTLLAMARTRRGFSLHQVDPDGRLTASVAHPPTEIDFAEDAAWIGDDHVAIADSDGDVAFYRVGADLSASLLGVWRREPRTSPLQAMDWNGGRLALGYHDGRVIVLDTSSLVATSWLVR